MRFFISGVVSDDDLRCYDRLKGRCINELRIRRYNRKENMDLLDKINEDLNKI